MLMSSSNRNSDRSVLFPGEDDGRIGRRAVGMLDMSSSNRGSERSVYMSSRGSDRSVFFPDEDDGRIADDALLVRLRTVREHRDVLLCLEGYDKHNKRSPRVAALEARLGGVHKRREKVERALHRTQKATEEATRGVSALAVASRGLGPALAKQSRALEAELRAEEARLERLRCDAAEISSNGVTLSFSRVRREAEEKWAVELAKLRRDSTTRAAQAAVKARAEALRRSGALVADVTSKTEAQIAAANEAAKECAARRASAEALEARLGAELDKLRNAQEDRLAEATAAGRQASETRRSQAAALDVARRDYRAAYSSSSKKALFLSSLVRAVSTESYDALQHAALATEARRLRTKAHAQSVASACANLDAKLRLIDNALASPRLHLGGGLLASLRELGVPPEDLPSKEQDTSTVNAARRKLVRLQADYRAQRDTAREALARSATEFEAQFAEPLLITDHASSSPRSRKPP